jgi:hypothetical protein
MSREDARKALGLDLNRPTALVQLGTGDSDVNEKMSAALSGLLGWKDLQVILTKAPTDKSGKSLAPDGLDIKVLRYFPLANVLHAFDAGVCATGYNGVHELLPAGIPTVFVSNIRGTDDQEARAQWCHDRGFALRADQSNLADITEKVRQLQDSATRQRLSEKCKELPASNGGAEIAKILFELATKSDTNKPAKFTYARLIVQDHVNRGLRHVANLGLRRVALVYRFLNPHIVTEIVKEAEPVFGDQTDAAQLRELIRGETRFEHLISEASEKYRNRRIEIAATAYGEKTVITKSRPL